MSGFTAKAGRCGNDLGKRREKAGQACRVVGVILLVGVGPEPEEVSAGSELAGGLLVVVCVRLHLFIPELWHCRKDAQVVLFTESCIGKVG